MIARASLELKVVVAFAILSALALQADAACPGGWTQLDGAEKSRTICADAAHARKQGKYLSVPFFFSWREAQSIEEGKVQFRSVRQTGFVDCGTGKSAMKTLTAFSNDMGTGQIVDQHDFAEESLRWEEELPKSFVVLLCGTGRGR